MSHDTILVAKKIRIVMELIDGGKAMPWLAKSGILEMPQALFKNQAMAWNIAIMEDTC